MPERIALSELIHQHVRVAIETADHEELRAALGGGRSYERSEVTARVPQRPSTSRRLDLAPHDGCPDDAAVAVSDHAVDHDPISDGQPCVLVLRDAHKVDGDAIAAGRLHGHQLAGDPLHAPVETDQPLLRYCGL